MININPITQSVSAHIISTLRNPEMPINFKPLNIVVILASGMFLIVFSGCSKETPPEILEYRNTYFPMEIGLRWTYKNRSDTDDSLLYRKDASGFTHILEREVVAIDKYDDKYYAAIKENTPPVGYVRSYYFRYTQKRNIESIIQDYDEIPLWIRDQFDIQKTSIWYNFKANAEPNWLAYSHDSKDAGPNRYKIELVDINQSVDTFIGSFSNCYKFEITDAFGGRLSYTEWLAEGVGVVRRDYDYYGEGGWKDVYLLSEFSKR